MKHVAARQGLGKQHNRLPPPPGVHVGARRLVRPPGPAARGHAGKLGRWQLRTPTELTKVMGNASAAAPLVRVAAAAVGAHVRVNVRGFLLLFLKKNYILY
jgi:hypothetical protein